MSRLLDVYLLEKFVGTLEQSNDGSLSFAYATDYLATALQAISLSLPLQAEPFVDGQVRPFFAGLLPEANVRQRLASYLGLSEQNAFALLEAIGGDCAGALALYPPGDKPSIPSDDVEVLDDKRLTDILELIKRRPMLAGEDGYRLSLAGAQNKLAVGFANGKVLLIKGGAPTTHILKPMIEQVKDSAHNELFCMQLAEKIGLEVAEASLHFVGNTPYYLVKRYDRQVDENSVVQRVHQEDFCQALGVSPELKYEREGGVGIADCQWIIDKYAVHPALDRIKLLNIIIFNYLIGNADAHGKNFSLLYRGERPQLAPAYDLLSTAVYPDFTDRMAMKIGGKYKPKEIYLRHFYKLVGDSKTAQSLVNKQIKAMTSKIIDLALELQLELQANGIRSEIFADIIKVIKQRCEHLNK